MSWVGTVTGLAVGGLEEVVGGEHQEAGLRLRLRRKRDVHGHLVAVEVGVVGGTDQRVELERAALDQDRLERLDAQAVEGRGAVEQHGVVLDDHLQRVPHVLDGGALDHLTGVFDVGGDLEVDQPLHDEGLEELERHLLGQAALVHLQLRPDDDDRTARIVDALAEEVLAETALFALEHVGEGFERAVVRPGDGTAAAAVVDERVDRLLEHPLLVAHDDVGRAELEQLLQAVVAVDDAAVEVV